MGIQNFCFSGNIQGSVKDFIVKTPIENGGVYTNKYCPQDLLTGGISSIEAVNGEVIGEFINDCQKQVIAMGAAGNNETILDTHIAGLMAVVTGYYNRI